MKRHLTGRVRKINEIMVSGSILKRESGLA
jgi:hypothetical protein